MPRNKHPGGSETDTDETDGGKTGQDTSRQAEGTGRCYSHIWTEKLNQHANHSVCFGKKSFPCPKTLLATFTFNDFYENTFLKGVGNTL